MKKLFTVCCLFLIAGLIGCGTKQGENAEVPSFTLSISEYPSWAAFIVADEEGIIDGESGKLGPIEEYWGVDIVLKESDYDTCITLYGTSQVDAACLTNIDTLAPSLSRPTTIVLPTSTSVGGDACLVTGWDEQTPIDEYLRDKTTHGLGKSVSQYTFVRNLEKLNVDPNDYKWSDCDPGVAAQAMQSNQNDFESIVVWNPFRNQTLKTRSDVRVGFDSSTIPEEIIDCVVVGRDVLSRPGGENFINAIIDAYYSVNDMIADPEKRDAVVIAIGANFSDLNLEEMEQVLVETRFYSTPDEALALFESDTFRTETMPRIVNFCYDYGILEPSENLISYSFDDKRYALTSNGGVSNDEETAPVEFSTDYIQRVKSKRQTK